MARQGKPRHKVVSSGRLTGCGRGQGNRKMVATGRHVSPLEPSYSLYSTDSEDQVTTIHQGLDRCAALLSGILQTEKTESTQSRANSQVPKMASSKLKPKMTHGKLETERKRTGKKSGSVFHIAKKKPVPVQKTILSSQSCPGVRGKSTPVGLTSEPVNMSTSLNPVTQTEHIKPHALPVGCPVSVGSSNHPSTGLQTATVFNCRLTTSTPALSPQRPTSAHSKTSHRGSAGEVHCFTQQWDLATGGQSSQQEAINTAAPQTQYTASVSMAPSLQQHPAASSLSAVHQAFISPEAKAELKVPCPTLVGSTGQSTALQPQKGSITCLSPTMTAHISTQVPVASHLQTYPQCTSPQEQQLPPEESSEESGGCTSEDDETPVRDTSCQTSMNKITVKLNQKLISPEKTAKKVMTVKYLLGELKTLVANQDSEAVRLITEVEQSISLLPAMVGSTNVQAELALALQPLRSENVQLRRRLRILNQQLHERERAERQTRSVDCNLELTTLQSLNLRLQTQLNDSQRELGNLQQENERLHQALEEKENDLKQSKEQCELETSRVRMDVNEALQEMRNCQVKLEDSEREKIALTQSLQQKEAETTRLQEIIRSLQKSPTRDIASHPAQSDVHRPPSQLTRSVLDWYENQRKGNPVNDHISDSIKKYLQTLEDPGHSSLSLPHSHNLSPPSLSQWRGREESCRLHEIQHCSPIHVDVPRAPQDSSADSGKGGDSDNETAFVPLRETVRVQPAGKCTQKGPLVQSNEGNVVGGENRHPGRKYLGLAFEKLGVSSGITPQDLKALNDNRGKDFLSHAEGVGSQLKRANEFTAELSEQSLNVQRHLKMDEAPAYKGKPSEFEHTFSSCDIKSLASDWSVNSWSTFNTRDERDFQNGLAALDASIASLQRTLKADLKK